MRVFLLCPWNSPPTHGRILEGSGTVNNDSDHILGIHHLDFYLLSLSSTTSKQSLYFQSWPPFTFLASNDSLTAARVASYKHELCYIILKTLQRLRIVLWIKFKIYNLASGSYVIWSMPTSPTSLPATHHPAPCAHYMDFISVPWKYPHFSPRVLAPSFLLSGMLFFW